MTGTSPWRGRRRTPATGGDDSAVSWNLTSGMAPFYEMPDYVNELPAIDRFNDELDAMDGARDGRWRDNSHRAAPRRLRHTGSHTVPDAAVREGDPGGGVRRGRRPRPAVPQLQGDRRGRSRVQRQRRSRCPTPCGSRTSTCEIMVDFLERDRRQGQMGAGAHRRSRHEPRPRGLGRVPDRHRQHRGDAERAVRRRRRRAADREVPHDRVLAERGRAAPRAGTTSSTSRASCWGSRRGRRSSPGASRSRGTRTTRCSRGRSRPR